MKNFVEKKITNLVMRRDYAKLHTDFVEPNLLEMQRASYNFFLEKGLGELISSYFPIRHQKNNVYEIHYHGIRLVDCHRDENQSRFEGKTYEQAVYVDLSLVNNETGEIKRAKKTAANVSDGIFFANIPMMTSNGTFIINGIEKFVISQIVRSPGAYVLTKSQIKLNNKKKVNEGYVCELLPAKGSMMNFWLDPKEKVIKITIRSVSGDNAPTFVATELLKAFGLNQQSILELFGYSEYITNSLACDGLTYENIVANQEIIAIRKSVCKLSSEKDITGPVTERKLKRLVYQYSKLVDEQTINRKEYDEGLKEDVISATRKKELLSLKNKIDAQEVEIRKILDQIIVEKAAKNLISLISISTRVAETLCLTYPEICYQDLLVRHFCERRQYDLSIAGRSKINHKMRITERLYQKVVAQDVFTKDGNILIKQGTLLEKDQIDLLKKELFNNNVDIQRRFKLSSTSIYQKNHPNFVECINLFDDNNKYDKYTNILGLTPLDNSCTILTLPDIISIISYTCNLIWNIGQYDDIDHLGNKRLRLIHEQLRNKLIVGMAKVEKAIKEKLGTLSLVAVNEEQREKNKAKATIKYIVNTKPFQQVVKNFFNSYQLTQYIDQQNPLSELTNKRRISAMGDGGIRREDPNLDIRDVHYSHYGRICPIETPEGMNIGLIMSLASLAKVDDFGFLVTPYYKVENGVVTNKIEWLNASREDEYIIGESTVARDSNGKIIDEKVVGRFRGMQEIYHNTQINYIDVSPRQVVSIAASVIPFLENDDTTRALMGANMQRQATPLLKPYAPIVGTGSEYKIAHDSGLSVLASEDGEVTYVDGNCIVIKSKETGHEKKYDLIKYRKTNQCTCTNQQPIVNVGQQVKKDDIIADGPAMYNGELALGRNALIAYTTWHGYNFEDAIVISSRLVQDDWYTSIQIEEYEITCLRTKNGDEEITRDLPNVSDDAKAYLDEDGLIMIGAEVKEGDVLVGKISPKGTGDFTPEEKLLNAIFGNKSRGYRDSSLKVAHGGEGTVAAIKRFRTINGDKLEDDAIELIRVYVVQKRKIQIGDKMSGRHGNKGIVSKVVPVEDMPYLEDGTPIDIMLNPLGVPSRMNLGQVLEVHLGLAMRRLSKKRLFEIVDRGTYSDIMQEFGIMDAKAKLLFAECTKYFKDQKITKWEEFSDLDLNIVLRQVGLAIEDLNYKAQTPVFTGAKIDDVAAALQETGIDASVTKGKMTLYDGRTGEKFDGKISVGVMYMLKLDHMVDDKIHARSVGPYSKVTQQPLGGRSQNGGQRFGEMEVWALEAYGAAYNLKEILTIKSDDVVGRNLTYNAIVKGKKIPDSSLPESFKLLSKQLQGLCLAMTVYDAKGNAYDINDFTSMTSSMDNGDISDHHNGESVEIESSEYNSNELHII